MSGTKKRLSATGYIRRVVRKLSVDIGPRAPGSPAEREAALWIKNEFEAMGLPVEIHQFESPSCTCTGSKLTADGKTFHSTPLQFSPAGNVAGEFVFLGDEEMAATATFKPGALGMLMPVSGLFDRQCLVRELAEKGLGGLVVITPMTDTVNGKIVRDPTQKRMPLVTVNHDVAESLMKYVGRTAELSVTATPSVQDGISQNVVASIRGTGSHWMAVCAHYDTASASPGALDNGCGVAALLAVAKRLRGIAPKSTIHFVASGSEEYGGLDMTGRGMLSFFNQMRGDLENCVCLIDIDDIGHKIGTPICYAAGPKPFRETAASVPVTLRRLFKERWKFEGGDNGAAHQFGIPYVWFYDHSLKTYYHTPKDTIRHVDFEKAAVFVDDIETMARHLADLGPFSPYMRTESVTVRPARFEDIPLINDITEKAFEPVSLARMRQDFFGERLGGKNWSVYKCRDLEAFCRQRIYQVIVAESAGRVVGYATWLFDAEQGIAEIGNNAVHPEFQGKGIGKALQQEIERRMREEGFTRFTVNTLGVDIAAQKLYEKLGYTRYAESIYYLRHRTVK